MHLHQATSAHTLPRTYIRLYQPLPFPPFVMRLLLMPAYPALHACLLSCSFGLLTHSFGCPGCLRRQDTSLCMGSHPCVELDEAPGPCWLLRAALTAHDVGPPGSPCKTLFLQVIVTMWLPCKFALQRPAYPSTPQWDSLFVLVCTPHCSHMMSFSCANSCPVCRSLAGLSF